MENKTHPPKKRTFLDIPAASELTGFSERYFRKIIREDKIPIMQIGRKFFILMRDFENWERSRKSSKRLIPE